MYRKKLNYIKIISSVILLGLLIFFGSASPFHSLRNVVLEFTAGIRRVIFFLAQSADNRLRFIFNSPQILKDDAALREENQKLIQRSALLEVTEKENAVLRSALKIKQEEKYKTSVARVIGFERQMRDEILHIDLGTQDGVALGDLVLTENRGLVGRVKEVGPHHALVLLVSSASVSYPAEILSRNLSVLARGNNDREILLDLVPAGSDVDPGDIVIASGKGDIFLRGLILGKVISVRKFDNKAFQEVRVQTLFDQEFLDEVIVVSRSSIL